ncbi:NUDIX domain-containing protein [Patescibacteria group bacterium]|nr:NUDIX domain-containing protein [Patescibacteria group bacterium]
MGKTKIVTVDENDNVVGAAFRKDAIKNGQAHRISRIFVFNPKGEVYLQKRAKSMEWGGLWDQSVGGHVDEGETYEQAARREAEEELGLTDLKLEKVATYYHEVVNPSGQLLKRYNCLFTSVTDKEPKIDPSEVEEGRWVSMKELLDWVKRSHDDFTGKPGGFLEALAIYEKRAHA